MWWILNAEPRDTIANRRTRHFLVGVGTQSYTMPFDTTCLEVIKELKRKDYLELKEDIKDHIILRRSCNPLSNMWFEYVAEWNPDDSLMSDTLLNLPALSHAASYQFDTLTHFAMFLGFPSSTIRSILDCSFKRMIAE